MTPFVGFILDTRYFTSMLEKVFFMDMNKAFFLKKENSQPKWRVIDAEGQVLGRLATQIADILRGKDSVLFTPHADAGDYVVVLNADKVVLTGNKLTGKLYERYTGWMGGLRQATALEMFKKHPTRVLELAVKGMLPKNRLSRQLIKKLKMYVGTQHPHQAQVAASK